MCLYLCVSVSAVCVCACVHACVCAYVRTYVRMYVFNYVVILISVVNVITLLCIETFHTEMYIHVKTHLYYYNMI